MSCWPESGLAPGQGTGTAWGRAAQLHPQHPNPIPCTPSAGAGSPQPAPCRPPAPAGPPLLNFGSQRRMPTASTPGCSRGHPPPIQPHKGIPTHLLDAGVVSSMRVTCSDWEERPRVPGARMLHAEVSWGPRRALPRAAARRSVRLSIRASSGLAGAPSCPVVGAQPVGKTPGGNVSLFSAAGATMGMAVTTA